MKKTILIAAAAVMTMTGFAASAQPWHGRDGRGYAERYDRYGRWDDRRGGRWDNRGPRFDDRGAYWGQSRWRQGQRFDGWRNRGYIVNDYRRYGWAPPPRGYAYYRADNGDVLMAALATGIIASVIAGGLNY